MTSSSEAAFIFSALFGGSVPRAVAERYGRACATVLPEEGAREMRVVVEKGLDLEAVEFHLRRRKPGFTARVQALTYLVEAEGCRPRDFVNLEPRRTAAVLSLGYHGLRTAYLALKGAVLCRRYGLV